MLPSAPLPLAWSRGGKRAAVVLGRPGSGAERFKEDPVAIDVAKTKEENLETRHLRLHPAWFAFIKYCEEVGFGEIDRLKIQDGLPMIAEEVRKKVGFAKGS